MKPPVLPLPELLRTARTAAADADRHARLTPATLHSIAAAGLLRRLVPTEYGGMDVSIEDVVHDVVEIGSACTSTGWAASLGAFSSRMVGFLPAAGRDRVWGCDPDAFVAAALPPLGRARRTTTGWTLTGTWPRVSFADAADWLLLAAMSEQDDQQEALFFAVPRAQARVTPAWDLHGMRAARSDAVTVAEVPVPADLAFARERLMLGQDWAGRPGATLPFTALSGLALLGPLLGAARAALSETVEQHGEKGGADRPRPDLVRSENRLDAVGLLLQDTARTLDRGLGAATGFFEARAAHIATELREVALLLLSSSGTSALEDSSSILRRVRDVQTGTSHIALRPEAAIARRTTSLVSQARTNSPLAHPA